jgi:hypothetical protein
LVRVAIGLLHLRSHTTLRQVLQPSVQGVLEVLIASAAGVDHAVTAGLGLEEHAQEDLRFQRDPDQVADELDLPLGVTRPQQRRQRVRCLPLHQVSPPAVAHASFSLE